MLGVCKQYIIARHKGPSLAMLGPTGSPTGSVTDHVINKDRAIINVLIRLHHKVCAHH